MARNSVSIYQFADFNFDEFLKQFLFEISEHTTTYWKPQFPPDDLVRLGYKFTPEQYEQLVKEYNTVELIHHKAKRGVRNPDIIKCKIQYLQHIIIHRAHRKEDIGAFSLNSQILKAIIGDEYKTMLSILIKMGYLRYGDGYDGHRIGKYELYSLNKYSMIYSVPEDKDFEIVLTSNVRVIKYLQKELEQMQLYRKTVLHPIIEKQFGKDFQRQYEISLSKIRLIDDEGFGQFVEQRISEIKKRKVRKRRRKTRLYYQYIRDGLLEKKKHIQRVDGAGRIYHVLTNSKREVKRFLNIAISADCKNSHPVLFNHFIFQSHNISAEDAYAISSAMHQIPEGMSVRGSLKEVISHQLLDLLKDDELNYIYQTSTGQFWDIIVSKHPECDRTQIKERMFRQVFYSNHEDVVWYQKLAREFEKQFPNVMKLIKFWKKQKNIEWVKAYMDAHGIYIYKPTAALSIAMMNLEARIFTDILKRMYSKRWRAFHIHDCIIVPQTRSKNQPTRDEVIAIMMDEYKKHGLAPTFD